MRIWQDIKENKAQLKEDIKLDLKPEPVFVQSVEVRATEPMPTPTAPAVEEYVVEVLPDPA